MFSPGDVFGLFQSGALLSVSHLFPAMCYTWLVLPDSPAINTRRHDKYSSLTRCTDTLFITSQPLSYSLQNSLYHTIVIDFFLAVYLKKMTLALKSYFRKWNQTNKINNAIQGWKPHKHTPIHAGTHTHRRAHVQTNTLTHVHTLTRSSTRKGTPPSLPPWIVEHWRHLPWQRAEC